MGAVLATAATASSVGTVGATGPQRDTGSLTVAWSGEAVGAGDGSTGVLRPGTPPPPSWTGGVLPSARHGQSVGDQLRGAHVSGRDLAAAELLGAAALRGDLPTTMQGAVAGIPLIVLDAYRQAAATMAAQDPRCGVPWWLLAGIGRIESDHAAGGRVDAQGTTRGTILGPLLDGSMPGTSVITDSDGGRLDGNAQFDRAVGPMQFLPSTWAAVASDGNGDGVRDPNNVYDASLGAARYLCAGGGNLRTVTGLTAAVLRYNASMSYVRSVLTWGTAYRDGVSVVPAASGRVPSGDPRQPADTPKPPPPAPRSGQGGQPPRVAAAPPPSSSGQSASPSPTSSGSSAAPTPNPTSPPTSGGSAPSPSGSGPSGSAGGPPSSSGSASGPAPSGSAPMPSPTGSTPTPTPTGSTPVPTPTSTTPSAPASPGPSSTSPSGGSSSPSPTQSQSTGVISGWVWDDENSNGQQDAGEPGVGGVTVQLLRDGQPVLVDGQPVTQQTADDPNNPATLGTYRFAQVPAGSGYSVAMTLPDPLSRVAGFTTASTSDPTASSTDSDVDSTGHSGTITLPADGSVQVDAGIVLSSLAGVAFQDTNGDGQRGDGVTEPVEPAATQPVTVTLTPVDANGTPVPGAEGRTQTTDGSGNYQFADLQPGRYLLQATPESQEPFSTPPGGREIVQIDPGTESHVNLGLEPPTGSTQPSSTQPSSTQPSSTQPSSTQPPSTQP
ncbi:MAG TPA: SdrD B-like domain-containing protein [Segeticoccus sp.]|uniref:SdrD B-like domain-containing protein n=1 Tax=Segeticoccus sp. TaxID=2706531 RepID=UPI002D7FFD8C|nr:SdrD B-like domain-containing protein [Segeticoccus sp.]HET8600220.1 SdrD B-like domain-containing protein [Segeticoccus sp.]